MNELDGEALNRLHIRGLPVKATARLANDKLLKVDKQEVLYLQFLAFTQVDLALIMSDIHHLELFHRLLDQVYHFVLLLFG